jgi:hypothetical protein
MSYQVSFYREVVNSYGKPSRTSLYSADIAARGSMDEAIANRHSGIQAGSRRALLAGSGRWL